MIVHSRLLHRAPRWRLAWRGAGLRLPKAARSWLFEAGSLTRRLRQVCGADFGVHVLREGAFRPFADERHLLGGGRFFIREVRLERAGEPLVLARTVIPSRTLKGRFGILARLGNRPLGEVLFACPHLERLGLEIAHVPVSAWRACAGSGDRPVWGRRSLYRTPGGEVLVSEFFLPAVLCLEG